MDKSRKTLQNASNEKVEFLPKTEPERLLIPTAVREARAGGLCLADATAVVTPVNLRLVEAKHRHFRCQCDGKNPEKGGTKIGESQLS